MGDHPIGDGPRWKNSQTNGVTAASVRERIDP